MMCCLIFLESYLYYQKNGNICKSAGGHWKAGECSRRVTVVFRGTLCRPQSNSVSTYNSYLLKGRTNMKYRAGLFCLLCYFCNVHCHTCTVSLLSPHPLLASISWYAQENKPFLKKNVKHAFKKCFHWSNDTWNFPVHCTGLLFQLVFYLWYRGLSYTALLSVSCELVLNLAPAPSWV